MNLKTLLNKLGIHVPEEISQVADKVELRNWIKKPLITVYNQELKGDLFWDMVKSYNIKNYKEEDLRGYLFSLDLHEWELLLKQPTPESYLINYSFKTDTGEEQYELHYFYDWLRDLLKSDSFKLRFDNYVFAKFLKQGKIT